MKKYLVTVSELVKAETCKVSAYWPTSMVKATLTYRQLIKRYEDTFYTAHTAKKTADAAIVIELQEINLDGTSTVIAKHVQEINK